MQVLVVGGSGFIGTRLIAALQRRGHGVRNFDSAESTAYPELTIIGDVRDAKALTDSAAGCDAIVNLAAVHRDDVRPLTLYQEVNVGGAGALVTAATAAKVERIVFTSSVAVYGLDKKNPSELAVPEPFNEYGRTKLEAEGVFRGWADLDPNRSLVIVRPSVVFGETNRGNVYTLARQVATGRFLMIGSGNNRKSMSYVGNIVEFLAAALEKSQGTFLINYADKPDLSTTELVMLLREALGKGSGPGMRLPLWLGMAAGHFFDLIARVTGRTLPISAVRIRKFAAETTIDTGALAEWGFRAPTPLTDALMATVTAEFGPALNRASGNL